jgi:broad specificity phosphatase PhoE
MPNPGLTDDGIKQAEQLLERISESKRMDSIDFILASPLERTLQTAMIAFEPALEKRLKIIAYPDLREYGRIPSSTGASLEDLKIYKNMVDLGLVDEGWETNYDVSRRHLRDGRTRDAKVRKELWRLGANALEKTKEWKHLVVGGREDETRDVEIVVVTHGGFLFELLDVKGESLHFCLHERMLI